MAGKSTAVAQKPRQEVAAQSSVVPEHLRGRLDQDAGKGVSTARADNAIPMVVLLQSNSPQVNERGQDYVKGAKPGHLWLRNVNEIVDGEEGIEVIPCYFDKAIVEWVPRDDGGGFVARHDLTPEEANEVDGIKRAMKRLGAVEQPDAKNPKKVRWVKNGNEFIETRYHFVLVNGMPYVIPLKSTGHQFSRDWMGLLNKRDAESGVVLPSFYKKYRITTKMREKDGNQWFVLRIAEELGWVSEQEAEMGRQLHDAVSSGEKKAEEYDAGSDEETSTEAAGASAGI